jgi:hypothetical protein
MASATGSVIDTSIKQICSTTLSNLLNQFFANTLGKETDIVKLLMAQIQHESHFNVNAQGPALKPINSSGARDYINASAVQSVLGKGIGQQSINVDQGLRAWGVMQSMGWNHVKGGSQKLGKCVIEIARPDLVSRLCVNPGESLSAKFNGQNTVEDQILAGLVILEQKYKLVKQAGNKFTIGQFTYDSRMQATFRGYIGLASNDKGNGSSAEAYVAAVYYGSSFTSANGPGGVAVANKDANGAAAGPTITVASGDNQHPPGC